MCWAVDPPGLQKLGAGKGLDHAGRHFLSPGYVPLRWRLLFSPFYRGANQGSERLNICPRLLCSQIPVCDQSPGHMASAIQLLFWRRDSLLTRAAVNGPLPCNGSESLSPVKTCEMEKELKVSRGCLVYLKCDSGIIVIGERRLSLWGCMLPGCVGAMTYQGPAVKYSRGEKRRKKGQGAR